MKKILLGLGIAAAMVCWAPPVWAVTPGGGQAAERPAYSGRDAVEPKANLQQEDGDGKYAFADTAELERSAGRTSKQEAPAKKAGVSTQEVTMQRGTILGASIQEDAVQESSGLDEEIEAVEKEMNIRPDTAVLARPETAADTGRGLGATAAADVAPDNVGAEAEALAQELDLGPIEAYLDCLDQAAAEILGAGGIQELWEKAKKGEISFQPKEILLGMARLFCQEILNNGKLLAQLALLAMVSTLLCQLQNGFASQGVASLSRGVIYTVLLGVALQSFVSLGNGAYQAVDTMSGLLYAVAPLLFTMLGAMGGVSTVALFHPAFLCLLGIGLNVIKTLVLPGVYCSAVFGVVSYISPKFHMSQLAKLCRDIAVGVMTVMLTLFTAALGIAGLAGSAINGLTIKAAKTAAGIFIPVVGRTLADTMDTVLSTSLVLKNTIGLFGVVAIFLACAVPAIKILAVSLLYRLTGALIEPLGDGELARALSGLGGALTTLFAVVAASGLLFFFLLSILIGMGNITMMMR